MKAFTALTMILIGLVLVLMGSTLSNAGEAWITIATGLAFMLNGAGVAVMRDSNQPTYKYRR